MAHPQEITVEQRARREHLSPLMRAKAGAQKGQPVNACPYGCGLRELDDHGYCRHLVGFTNDGKAYEPMALVGGKRRVRVRKEPLPGQQAANVLEGEEPLTEAVLEAVRPTDKLVRITVSSRVYRDVDGAGERLGREAERRRKQELLEQRKALLADLRHDPELRQGLMEALTGPAADTESAALEAAGSERELTAVG